MCAIRLIVATALAVAFATTAAAQGGNPNLARDLAATCANCHGTNGISQGEVDSLAGKPKGELVQKLKEFKSGARPGTIMPQLAKGYTDDQFDLMAGWFASQKPAAK